MSFQASDLKERQFLDLLDNNNNIIEPSYAKGGFQLKAFGYLNSLCMHAMRVITNHALIGEYRLIFFPMEEFRCPCGLYPIESRHYILHECRRFNRYWNLKRNSLCHFVMFLKANLSVFAFIDSSFSLVMSRSHNQSYMLLSLCLFQFTLFCFLFSFSFSFYIFILVCFFCMQL